MTNELECRALFDGTHADPHLWRAIEDAKPRCLCEAHSVGQNTPGPVADEEIFVRLIISPRDRDENTGEIASQGFRKVHANGVSGMRGESSNEELLAIAEEMMPHSNEIMPSEVMAICEAPVAAIRALVDDDQERIFSVYDQTVPRRDSSAAPFPHHTGLFARRPPRGEKQKKGEKPPPKSIKELQRDYVSALYDLFMKSTHTPQEYRDGLFEPLNERARKNEFYVAPEPIAETSDQA